MTYWQDLSDAELRARLSSRGLSKEWIEEAIERREEEKWATRIQRLLG